MSDGAHVLAPVKDHELERGMITDTVGGNTPAFHRWVTFAGTGETLAVPEDKLVAWDGYMDRVGSEASSSLDCQDVSIWRSEISVEGFWSLTFWALGFLETEHCARPAARLLIDWTDDRILFHAASTSRSQTVPANCWSSFFEQPLTQPTAATPRQPGRLSVVTRFGPPWFHKLGRFRGADEGGDEQDAGKGGRLDAATADEGRAAFGRWLRVRRHVAERAAAAAESTFGKDGESLRWLAVHIRRTDKLAQCKGNHIGKSSLVAQALAFCTALGCGGIFLCSDDAAYKQAVASALVSVGGVRVATHAALLSSRKKPSHKDSRLDRRLNAEDCLIETLLMGQHCMALLSTWSNVSVAAVYLSPPGYRHFLFGDAPPRTTSAPRVAPAAALAVIARGDCRVRGRNVCRFDWRSRRKVT